jgi:hypothetical protein
LGHLHRAFGKAYVGHNRSRRTTKRSLHLSSPKGRTMNTRIFLAFGLIALLGAACGGSKSSKSSTPGTTTLACNYAAEGLCVAATGTPSAADITAFNTECTTPSPVGVPGTSCPTAGRVGRCTLAGTNPSTVINVFPPLTAADGQTLCTTNSGTWTAG